MRELGTDIPEVRLFEATRHGDARGFFSETYNSSALAALGIKETFVQDNHSLSQPQWTVRGLHYQKPPFAQDKLVRVVRGSVLDVAVDIRRGSPTFGRHVSAVLSAENWRQMYVPKGFAHAFCTVEPDTEVIYKVTDFYAPDHEDGILWNDPELGIDWPMHDTDAVLSDKDRVLPLFASLASPF